MKLSNFDIHFDEENKRILILKTPNTGGRAAAIEIKPSGKGYNEAVNFALETANKVTIRGYFEIQINKE
jgi:hypothetical protein